MTVFCAPPSYEGNRSPKATFLPSSSVTVRCDASHRSSPWVVVGARRPALRELTDPFILAPLLLVGVRLLVPAAPTAESSSDRGLGTPAPTARTCSPTGSERTVAGDASGRGTGISTRATGAWRWSSAEAYSSSSSSSRSSSLVDGSVSTRLTRYARRTVLGSSSTVPEWNVAPVGVRISLSSADTVDPGAGTAGAGFSDTSEKYSESVCSPSSEDPERRFAPCGSPVTRSGERGPRVGAAAGMGTGIGSGSGTVTVPNVGDAGATGVVAGDASRGEVIMLGAAGIGSSSGTEGTTIASLELMLALRGRWERGAPSPLLERTGLAASHSGRLLMLFELSAELSGGRAGMVSERGRRRALAAV
ncbi:uncharacterized protein LOC62_01G000201 [Vanrija pseudolonga]|uniref:Uncharacterized protein n=1 Tax=Vanrija pseudolonga TaxID=143232 RepID=A0AAF0Y2W0_9TREE|nr:hypothetical protein LOC62_01G000201 [Vanrija pseudolonga]